MIVLVSLSMRRDQGVVGRFTCLTCVFVYIFFFSSRRRHTRLQGDWSSDVCSSDLFGQTAVDFFFFDGGLGAGLGLKTGRYDHTATQLANGQVLVTGGQSTSFGN